MRHDGASYVVENSHLPYIVFSSYFFRNVLTYFAVGTWSVYMWPSFIVKKSCPVKKISHLPEFNWLRLLELRLNRLREKYELVAKRDLMNPLSENRRGQLFFMQTNFVFLDQLDQVEIFVAFVCANFSFRLGGQLFYHC